MTKLETLSRAYQGCWVCKAMARTPCLTKSGKQRRPHKYRLFIPDVSNTDAVSLVSWLHDIAGLNTLGGEKSLEHTPYKYIKDLAVRLIASGLDVVTLDRDHFQKPYNL